jgi:hypothetical protein
MQEVTTIAIDIAKRIFAVFWVDPTTGQIGGTPRAFDAPSVALSLVSSDVSSNDVRTLRSRGPRVFDASLRKPRRLGREC